MGHKVPLATVLVPGVNYCLMNSGLVVGQNGFIYLKQKDEGK